MKHLAILFLGLLLSFGFAQTDTSSDDATTEAAQETTEMVEDTVINMIATNPDLSMLYAALQTAGLEATLTGEGPFTIPAPTNEAFSAAGIDPAAMDPVELQTVLLYHVASGDLATTDVTSQSAVMI